jgi:heme-degrading monooxygenase HmoA
MMYGTIAKMHVKPGMEAELERHSREEVTSIPGFVFEHAYRMGSDPQAFMLVVGFESEEAYRKNAESPEQHARYEKYRALLDADPEWYDGEIAFSVQS